MNKLEQIKNAIYEANLFRSKLAGDALIVSGFTSLKIRHLMNNLGAISHNYLDCGSHKGATICSVIYENPHIIQATSIDNVSEFDTGDVVKELLNNVGKYNPPTVKFKFLQKDCWTVMKTDLPNEIDLYLYDAAHDYESQRKGCTHFLESMSKEFIFCVDDASWESVQKGTDDGLKDSGCEVLFDQLLWDGVEGNNFGYWNGFRVMLLRKP